MSSLQKQNINYNFVDKIISNSKTLQKAYSAEADLPSIKKSGWRDDFQLLSEVWKVYKFYENIGKYQKFIAANFLHFILLDGIPGQPLPFSIQYLAEDGEQLKGDFISTYGHQYDSPISILNVVFMMNCF